MLFFADAHNLHSLMRKTKCLFTYDSVLKVLENYPELLEGREKALNTTRDVIAKEFEWPSVEYYYGYGLLHGDFWSGWPFGLQFTWVFI
jgi:hypothetical protein